MIDDAPNYAIYSLEELHDVKKRINVEKYPDRYRIVVEEIARRELQPTTSSTPLQKIEPSWHSVAKRLYFVLFFTIWCGGFGGGFIYTWIYNHGLSKPTATHTQPLKGQKSHSPVVYVTPTAKTIDNAFSYFGMPGIPLVLGLGFLLHCVVGVNLNERKSTSKDAL